MMGGSNSGRRKKPSGLKKRDGTYRADRDSDSVDPGITGEPPIPAGLHAVAVAEWRRLAPRCIALGLLTDADWMAWRIGFTAYSTWLTIGDLLADGVLTVTTESGYRQARPEVAIGNQAAKAVMTFCAHFGLTPSARATLDIKPPGHASTEGLSYYLN